MANTASPIKDIIISALKGKTLSSSELYDSVKDPSKPKKRMFSRHVQRLIEQGIVEKIGEARNTYFRLVNNNRVGSETVLDKELNDYIEANYSYLSSTGDFLFGVEALVKFHEKHNQNFKEFAEEYVKVSRQFNGFKKDGYVDLTDKLKASHDEVYLSKVIANDFYSLPKFGKTNLANLVYLAKQSQNIDIIKDILKTVRYDIQNISKKFNISAILVIPPTVKREVQLMNSIGLNLNIDLPRIEAKKVGLYRVSQKTLKGLKERVDNARVSIKVINPNVFYESVLIIDDAVGSGATINEVAKKLIEENIAKKVYAYSIVGSQNGFDVISEV